ncbi:MAG: hypothetical protein KDA41_09780, partial [Planctomycetales bacterium]|nr:hypothetical protein [Planctomycetales bacterium]
VDATHRALMDVAIRGERSADPVMTTTWIDTAFNGCLVFPRRLIEDLRLVQQAETDAILADGSRVTLKSYVCFVEWFGKTVAAQVIANEGSLPLLGTELLIDRRLLVDYAQRTVEIS